MNDNFASRHVGPRPEEVERMLKVIGVSSMDELIDKTIPAQIRLKEPLQMDEPMSESAFLEHTRQLALKNKLYKSYIGMGYYGCATPAVIVRNILENPGWYTSYTPYQAEISQGRLEALLNYQTVISDMTKMPLANASLLDEATAAAEAMIMFFNARSRDMQKNGANVFLASEDIFPQTLHVIKTRAKFLGINVIVAKESEFNFTAEVFGAIVQYPNQWGEIKDYAAMTAKAKEMNIRIAVATDLMALALLTPPGEWGADCVVGSSQRFGLPMGFGGPTAGFFASIKNLATPLSVIE